MTGQNLLGLEDADGGRILVHAEAADGTKWDILADIVIGADGPKSRVGAHVNGTNWQMIPALQVTLPLVTPLDHTRVYFDERLCAGYAWLFPKGNVANVGLGAVPNADRGTLAKDLKAFVEAMIREELVTKGVRPICTGGWIPVQERPCVPFCMASASRTLLLRAASSVVISLIRLLPGLLRKQVPVF